MNRQRLHKANRLPHLVPCARKLLRAGLLLMLAWALIALLPLSESITKNPAEVLPYSQALLESLLASLLVLLGGVFLIDAVVKESHT